MARIVYREINGTIGFYAAFGTIGLVVLIGLASAWYMEAHGHIVTGMTNEIVWGLPHVFAVFLIVSASGILNIASLSSVFRRLPYKPEARLSGTLAIALLAAGLAILVLDLGRPDRIIVAMTTYNFKSIFAWNIFLYTGFIAIVAAYLVVQMTRKLERHADAVGLLAFIWRLILTTGTGSIFGWLVARQAYHTAVMAPLFIAMSLSCGLAIFILVRMAARMAGYSGGGAGFMHRHARLLGIFAAAVLYFTAVQHLTSLYSAERAGVERFLLMEGGIYPLLFWIVQVTLGGIMPILLVFAKRTGTSQWAIAFASLLVIAGGLAQIYVIIIGGQAYPLVLFPGMEASSSFHDGAVAAYTPSWPEIGLALGGVALAAAITMLALRVLRILPEGDAETALDPHLGPHVGLS